MGNSVRKDEGFDLYVQVKDVGEPFRLTTQWLRFRYTDAFGLILDAWRLYDDLLGQKIQALPYQAGTGRPAEINRLE